MCTFAEIDRFFVFGGKLKDEIENTIWLFDFDGVFDACLDRSGTG